MATRPGFRWAASAVLVVLLTLIAAAPAHAYLDPAAGSMTLQLVLGGVAGLAVALRVLWRRLRGLTRRDDAAPR